MKTNRILITAAVVLVLFLGVGRLGGIYVDWLWFQEVGYQSVFLTQMIAQLGLFAIGALAFFAVFAGNVLVAGRVATRYERPAILLEWPEPKKRLGLLQSGLLVVGALLGLLVGAGIGASWGTVLRSTNPTAFGSSDPLFGLDVGFFVFTLPAFQLAQGWLAITLFLSLVAVLVVYGVRIVLPRLPAEGEAFQVNRPNVTRILDIGFGGRVHLAVLIALMALILAFGGWLDIYGLVYSSTGLVFGAGYADVHARWPALWLMVGIAVLFAVLALVTIPRQRYGLLLVGVGIWFAASVVAVDLYPGVVQRFEVQPSELDKERPYIENNIKLTNQAYALDRIAEVDYPAEEAVTAEEIQANPGTIKNIRLWDPRPLLDTYNQVQSIRLYYDFLDVDVDRYNVNGDYRQVMLSARELSPEKLASQAQTWVNRRLQFTHGYGVAMSPINEVTPEGLPELLLRDVPPQGQTPLSRPEIYFGENTSEYVIVKTSTLEFDYPKGDDNVYVEYQGNAGVDMGSLTRRLLFAWQFGDTNILLSNSINSDSKIMYNR
ncbi:MAG: UPF0182 family protein, partial [Chloroflexota bacterium]